MSGLSAFIDSICGIVPMLTPDFYRNYSRHGSRFAGVVFLQGVYPVCRAPRECEAVSLQTEGSVLRGNFLFHPP